MTHPQRKSTYSLENESEFDRLEHQSEQEHYDIAKELRGIDFSKAKSILDIGCGSGVVTRHLAKAYPHAQIIGCDSSEIRVKQTEAALASFKNVRVIHADASEAIPFPAGSVDAATCRFVLEHLSEAALTSVLKTTRSVIRPGGMFCIIDIDGYLHNLFPQTPHVSKVLKKLRTKRPMDLEIGRKLPALLVQTGFENVNWEIQLMNFQGEALQQEANLIEERFEQARPFLSQLLASESQADRFFQEYLRSLAAPGAVLFYNKFIVTGSTPIAKNPLTLIKNRT